MPLLLNLDDGTIREKLLAAVEPAREAAILDAGEDNVGEHVGVHPEDAVSVSHLFDATLPGYRGWRWTVVMAITDEDVAPTVSEVTLCPGPDALVSPPWVPWERRVQPGDLGVGDILPPEPDDMRLVPAHHDTDDPEQNRVADEIGLGRRRVMSRDGRNRTATRWHRDEYGPRSDMARAAANSCGTCGFYLPLSG